jgi:microcystin-dependent protein
MASPYLSQILMFGGNYAPRNYALCNGQTLAINQNTALFSLLGTTYGGNGVNTFMLPNLQSSLAMSFGQGPGLSNYAQGQTGGTPTVELLPNQVPSHTHNLMASTSTSATTASAISNTVLPGSPSVANANLYATPPGNPPLQPQIMAGTASGISGNNTPHTNLMPSVCISFAIALSGVFPTRN